MYLFLVHNLILVAAAYAAARRLHPTTVDRCLATAALAWGNLVVTSLLLACFHRLGDAGWFFRTSAGLAVMSWLLLRRLTPASAPAPAAGDRFNRPLLAAFILTLVPIAYASVRIASTYVPNNYDSLSYHLPRTMYYLGQNTLAHFDTGNPRQTYFPFNYNLLQLFALIYSPPLQCLNFLNLAAWATAGLAVYRLSRLCDLGANAALVAAWLALTSTQVLAQATATTNDLPTGAGLLCVLVFVLRWRESRLTRDALLAGLAAGLTAGSKLTVIFFAPAAGLILLALGWQHWRRGETRRLFRGLRAWLAPGLLALALAAPFALINLAEKGEWINQTYDYTLNRPFSFASVVQTGQAYLVQLFLEPLHRFTFDLQFTAQLNAWGQRTFFPHWNPAHAFSPFYLFPPDLNEDHVWFGFAGPFILVCAAVCLLRFRRVSAPAVWLAALGLGWLATYFLLNKWSLYNQRYFVPAILVMSPCVAVFAQAGWARPAFRRTSRYFLVLLGLSALWLAGIYLFKNTSRPYAPLWSGEPPPPALPALPSLLARRIADQPRVNIDSTHGNERIFLLMTSGRQQRFTSFDRTVPSAYNVFSFWGFPRMVAYSNIEQLSSFTLVHVPAKRTAGVEFLATIGTGQEALDYYGLVPDAALTGPGHGDRNVLVTLYYGPRDPGRYEHLRIKVAGLNEPDQARLRVGVEYADHTAETLATFTTTGEARASVRKPFRRFTVRVEAMDTGEPLGATDIPYLVRNLPPEVDAPVDPALLFADELVVGHPEHIPTEGLAAAGPEASGQPLLVRAAEASVVRLEIPETEELARLETTFTLRLGARAAGHLDVVFNGQLVKDYALQASTGWTTQTVQLTPQPGKNVLEFRNVSVGTEPDWTGYLERYPDVKNYVLSQNIPLEKGAQAHYESHGRGENRVLHPKRRTETLPASDRPYFLFRSLRVHGFRQP